MQDHGWHTAVQDRAVDKVLAQLGEARRQARYVGTDTTASSGLSASGSRRSTPTGSSPSCSARARQGARSEPVGGRGHRDRRCTQLRPRAGR